MIPEIAGEGDLSYLISLHRGPPHLHGLTMKKVLRKYVSCSGFKFSRKPENESLRGDSMSVRRFLANPSLTRGPSLNGITPLQSPSDGASSDFNSMENLKTAIKTLERLIDGMSEKTSSRASSLESIQNYVSTNVPQLGQILEKFGGAINGQVPGPGFQTNGNEIYQEVTHVLKDLSHCHWVGAFFIILCLILDRCFKMRNFQREVVEHMKSLKNLGRHVLKFHGQVQDIQDSVTHEILQKSVHLICDHAAFCGQAMEKRSKLKRFTLAETDQGRLVELKNETNQLYLELNLTVNSNVLQCVLPEPTGETFEPLEETADMVGHEERVEGVLRKLESHEGTKGVFAFVLFGMPGSGKSTVLQHVAATLKTQKNFDKHNCCRINMRRQGSEDKESSAGYTVQDKQEELYSGLSKGEKRKFHDCKEGNRELGKLFRSRLRTEPALIYLDNVHKTDDLDMLLPGDLNTSFHHGSIFLVTTADQGVIPIMESKGVICLSRELRELQEKQAKTLLLKKIFAGRDVSKDSPIMKKLMQNQHLLDLLNFCGGVPLALNVVGSSIRTRVQIYLRERLGESAFTLSFETAYEQLNGDGRVEFLKRLTSAVNHAMETLSQGDPINYGSSLRLHSSLQFAFEQLCLPSVRRLLELFLDIVAVHLDKKWEDVELLYNENDLATLKQMSLVTRSVYKDGSSKAIVQVHDLLIGVGRRLENMDSSYRRVVLPTGNSMYNPYYEPPECFQNFISGAYKPVEVLKLDNLKDIVSAEQLDRVTTNLRHLELLKTDVTGTCRTIPPQLKYLKSRHSSLPFPLQELKKLVILDLDQGMDSTSNIEVIESMPHLHKLKVENSMTLTTLGPGLRKLRTVFIENCPRFKNLGPLNSASVQQLKIVDCPEFEDFVGVTRLECLERLSLAGFEFTIFPKELVIPSGVQIMDLSRNKRLKMLPTFAQRNRMKRLNLRFCPSLEELNILSESLEYLDVGSCAMLEPLLFLKNNFRTLKVLDVQGCTKLQSCLEFGMIMDRGTPSDFRLIGWNKQAEDDEPVGCACLKRCFRTSYKKSQSTDKVPKRTLKACCTFPPRKVKLW